MLRSCVTHRLQDAALKDVHAMGLQCEPQRLTELTFVQAAIEHAVDDGLQTRIDDLRILRVLNDGDALLRVVVDALGCRAGRNTVNNENTTLL